MKKIVNILIMEPKPMLMDLTKRAIEAKPDDKYDLKIVGTATNAKAGYFELYKHRPHILLLDPELEDEDGLSFIHHALERMPYLKIIVIMSSRLHDEQEFLDSGANDIVHVPIQRAMLWRKLDQLIQEVDSIGLLDASEYIPYDEEPSLSSEELFQFEDPSKNREYVPIFEDIRNSKEDIVDSNEEEPIDSMDSTEEIGEGNDLPIISDELVILGSLENSPNEETDLIVENDDNTHKNQPLFETSEDENEDNDNEEVILFDPFNFDDKEESSDEKSSEDELITFEPFLLDNEEVQPNEQESSKEELSTSIEEDNDLFMFELNEDEVDNQQEELPLENPQENLEEVHLDQSNKELNGIEKVMDSDEDVEKDDEIPVLNTEMNDRLVVENDEMIEDDQHQKSETEFHSEETTQHSKEEKSLLLELEDNSVQETESPQGESIENIHHEVNLEIEQTSNTIKTSNLLYFDSDEYNKTTMKARRSFDDGFYNRDGNFVPLYPPREQFNLNVNGIVQDVDIGSYTIASVEESEEKPEDSLFSSVKKIFKR